VLAALYAWYRATAPVSEKVQRDRTALPELDALLSESGDALIGELAKALGGGPLIALALDFWTWRRLAAEGLDDDGAARLMARVASAA
jgi:hypothetical protein